ncbi:MAG: hypothetical protein HZC36_15085, partial [Armatimonadetes bacterium]|nr:hypothetical protein [Armatimonadota bacterium]
MLAVALLVSFLGAPNPGHGLSFGVQSPYGAELHLVPQTGHAFSVSSAVYSADGRRILTSSDDKTARVWDAGTGRELMKLEGHSHVVNSAVYSADGRRILTSSYDKTARVWDAETGRELMKLEGHSDVVNSAV